MIKKLLVMVIGGVFAAISFASPPARSPGVMAVSEEMQDQGRTVRTVYTTEAAEPELAPVSAAREKGAVEGMAIAAGKRSNGQPDKRSRQESATAAHIDRSMRMPLLL